MSKVLELVRKKRKNNTHTGEYLTMEVANRYHERAAGLSETQGQMIGERRILCQELMSLYGVTEIEAICILQGFNIGDYVNKYSRKRCESLMEHWVKSTDSECDWKIR